MIRDPSDGSVKEVDMNGHEQFFLANLIDWTGAATTEELSPQISQKENSARQSCKRKGWVVFERPYWRITDAGRKALADAVQSHIRAMAS